MAEKKSLLTLSLPDACKQILHIGDTNGISATTYVICDGNGDETPLYINTTKLGIGDDNPNQMLGIKGANVQISIEEDDDEFLRLGIGESEGIAVIGYDDGTKLQIGVYDSPTDATLTPHMTIDSSGKVGLMTDAPTEPLDINGNGIRIRTAQTPASAGATGDAGTICWDTGYIYVCTATDTWERVAIAGW